MIKILLMRNGLTAAFNAKGEQMPDLQKPWVSEYLNVLLAEGISPADVEIEFPDGRKGKFFRLPAFEQTPERWGWEIE